MERDTLWESSPSSGMKLRMASVYLAMVVWADRRKHSRVSGETLYSRTPGCAVIRSHSTACSRSDLLSRAARWSARCCAEPSYVSRESSVTISVTQSRKAPSSNSSSTASRDSK
ncbi:Uncharacterised protein [Mycobacteroides abscessus subsp. abscessus]|nr:Uncharacterised protein [Mycobacteroides abscessus subsp. abscessus]